MNCYEFSIIASGLSIDDDEWQDSFFEAGCDDAVVGVQRGLFVLHFDRVANSLEEAIATACEDVEAAGADVRRIEPDSLVSGSDIADRSGLSRQAISLYVSGQRSEGFPTPVTCATTARPLWNWTEVAAWLQGKGKLDMASVEAAKIIEKFNSALPLLSAASLQPKLGRNFALGRFTKAATSSVEVQVSRSAGPKFRTPIAELPPLRGIDFLRPERQLAH